MLRFRLPAATLTLLAFFYFGGMLAFWLYPNTKSVWVSAITHKESPANVRALDNAHLGELFTSWAILAALTWVVVFVWLEIATEPWRRKRAEKHAERGGLLVSAREKPQS
jgi:hypothetical protein